MSEFINRGEQFPKPEREFEHLPARIIERAEAQHIGRIINITTKTYQG